MDGETITLDQALGLLSLPRLVGIHPETGLPIEANLGRFGPYVKMGAIFGSLDKDDDILSVGLNRAVDVIARKMASQRVIGLHPKGGETVQVRKGRFGPYVQHGQTVANLPRGVMMDDITLPEAVALLAEKGKQLKPRGAKGRKAKAAPAKAAPAPEAPRKAPVKRPATKAKTKAKAKKKAVKK